MINIQPIEKVLQHGDPYGKIDVHSIFYTIQGEGPLTGHPAIFVRLAGCNLQCPGCDTDYTSRRNLLTPETIVAEVKKYHQGPRLVVITGGEPFRQPIGLLTLLLEDSGYQIQIETNGTLPPPPVLAMSTWIVVSPKAGKVNKHTEEAAVAYKYVLDAEHVDPEDGLPTLALGHTAHPRVARPPASMPVGAVYVQPRDEQDAVRNASNVEAVVNTCMKHGYTLQLQLHKLLNME